MTLSILRVGGLEALQYLGGTDAAFPTTNFSRYLAKQERGYWGGKKQMDIWKQD